MAFAKQIESDIADYQGTMDAVAFEGTPPAFNQTNLIRSDQNWGVKVDWEVHGTLVQWLDGEFRVRAYLESMGPGPELTLPLAAPNFNAIGTKSVPNVANTRTYTDNISVTAGAVAPGTYKLVTLLQLYDAGNPTTVAGMVEGPILTIFQV